MPARVSTGDRDAVLPGSGVASSYLSVCVDPVLCRLTERRRTQVSAMQLRRRTLRETQVLNTGWVKKISCCTVIDISKARQ